MHTAPATYQKLPSRSAVTVLEVLFATMVVVVGLIGIASVIPVAARNAQEANSHTSALNLGLAWTDCFIARGLHQSVPSSSSSQFAWMWYRDYNSDPTFSPGPSWEIFRRDGYTEDASARNRVCGSIIPFESPSFSVAPAGRGDDSRRIWGHLPVCVDPYFFSSESANNRIRAEVLNGTPTRIGSYRCSVFPYFNDRFDPVADPFASPTLGIDQPRMLRVGLAGRSNALATAATLYLQGMQPVQRATIAGMFSSTDDLVVDDSVDESLSAVDRNSRPSRRLFSMSGTSALRHQTEGQFTWMATVVPFEPQLSDVDSVSEASAFSRRASESSLVSFVILHRHSHEYIADGSNPIVGDSQSQPAGERMARVYPLSGDFGGGTGGRVRLIANDTVSSKLQVGDWLMLGRYYLIDSGGRPYPFFRWYRIIGTSAEVEYGQLQSLAPTIDPDDPMSQGVWARDIVLEGPDFAFGSTPTFATMVSGVVTVIERQVRIE